LCRLIIYGKPIEVRLAQQLISAEAAAVHRTLLGAFNGKALKSTMLGDLTNSVLASHGCPGIHDMRHVREHFSTELALSDDDLVDQMSKNGRANHAVEIAATASNHSAFTAHQVYAGVFEKHR
jgi:hypothetical protein